MNDLLTPTEDEQAASQGWGLHDVYDLQASRWRVMVLGVPNAEAASQRVIAQARAGSGVALKALRLVMKGVVPNSPKKGKKK